MTKGITTDFYKQFEEIANKLDMILLENKELKKNHKKEMRKLKKDLTQEFRTENEELKSTIRQKDETIEKLMNEIDRLKNQINKNSNNSSKSSSTNTVTPKKKTGANLYNYRIKTGKKLGGQPGHVGHSLNKEKIEKLIENKKIKVKEIFHITNNRNKKDIIKYRLGLDINVYVEKHIFKHSDYVKTVLPKEFYTDVTYDDNIKALSVELGVYNVVAYDRMSDFFDVISKGILKISNGTLVNFVKEFSNKSKTILTNFENEILNSEILFTDETVSKYNKSKIYIRNYSNEKTILYKKHEKKGHKAIEDHDLLTKFTGGIVHDHDTAMYKYGANHYECIVHLGRYFEELIENITNITWPRLLKEMLFEAYKQRKELLSQEKKYFSNEKILSYEKRYDELIELSKKENKGIKSAFYKEKAKKLSNRCEKYKENHIAFIKDFKVPFDNNASERALRIVKTKTKVSGGFRSKNGCDNYCNTISIINTAKKRGINPFKAILSVFHEDNIFVN